MTMTMTTNTATVGKYVDNRVRPASFSSGLRKNRSVDEGGDGGWEQQGKEERSAPVEEKQPILPPRETTRNALRRKPKQTMEETGRSQREEGGAVGGRLPAARQTQIPIGAHDSEDIP